MTPKIATIITSYLPESKRYLDLCIESVKNLNYPKENLDVLIVGRDDYLPDYPSVRTVSPGPTPFFPPKGLNYGASCAPYDSEYLFMINDDVILTKNCLINMINILSVNPNIGLLMPIGNDCQSKYWCNVGIPHKSYEYDQLAPHLNTLMNTNSIYPSPSLIFHDQLCLYAVLMKKKVYEEIGPFDESLQFQDDIDYSLRSRKKGFLNAITMDSIVYHFGGVSTATRFSSEERSGSMAIFNDKWNKGWRS